MDDDGPEKDSLDDTALDAAYKVWFHGIRHDDRARLKAAIEATDARQGY